MSDEDSSSSGIRLLGNHFVAIIGTYVTPSDGEKARFRRHGVPPNAERKLYALSAFPIIIDNQWKIITAGHAIKTFVEGIDSEQIFSAGEALYDRFGDSIAGKDPSPVFKYNLRPSIDYWIDDSKAGLDYAVLNITQNEAACLVANGIAPLIPSEQTLELGDRCDKLILFGLPSEFNRISSCKPGEMTIGEVRITTVSVTRNSDSLDTAYPMISGNIINLGSIKSIVGMSGGPVFGMNEIDQQYTIVGVQSRWLPRTRVISGTSIRSIVQHYATVRNTM